MRSRNCRSRDYCRGRQRTVLRDVGGNLRVRGVAGKATAPTERRSRRIILMCRLQSASVMELCPVVKFGSILRGCLWGCAPAMFSRCPLGTDTSPIASVMPVCCLNDGDVFNSQFFSWLSCVACSTQRVNRIWAMREDLAHFPCS